jgi:hypothetical protein
MVLRVSSRLPSFSGPLQQAPRFPRLPAPSVPPSDASSGLPESGIFQLCIRSRSQLFESSRLQASSNLQFLLLLLHRRPIPRATKFPWLLGSRTLRRSRRLSSGSPRRFLSSGIASGELPGFPELSPPAPPTMLLQVSPNSASSGCAASTSSSVPESCFRDWVDDDSPAGLEPCILGPRPRMNLRVLPGLAHSCQTLDAFSISIRPSAAVSSRVLPYSIQFRIVLFGGNCVSRSLLGHQLVRP